MSSVGQQPVEVLLHALRIGLETGEQLERADCLAHRHRAAVHGAATDGAGGVHFVDSAQLHPDDRGALTQTQLGSVAFELVHAQP